MRTATQLIINSENGRDSAIDDEKTGRRNEGTPCQTLPSATRSAFGCCTLHVINATDQNNSPTQNKYYCGWHFHYPSSLVRSGGLSPHHLVRRQIWTYEGRQVSSPRFQNLRPEYLSGRAISLSEDAVAILDRTSPKSVRVCDVSTGRPLADGKASEVVHECEVVSGRVLDVGCRFELC